MYQVKLFYTPDIKLLQKEIDEFLQNTMLDFESSPVIEIRETRAGFLAYVSYYDKTVT